MTVEKIQHLNQNIKSVLKYFAMASNCGLRVYQIKLSLYLYSPVSNPKFAAMCIMFVLIFLELYLKLN